MTKNEILSSLEAMANGVDVLAKSLNDKVVIDEYYDLVRTQVYGSNTIEIWTDALNTALCEHSIVEIPYKEHPYYIDDSIIMHSNNRIEADKNAVVRQLAGTKVLMLRNENVVDETDMPSPLSCVKDSNISINGGIWEEMQECRQGYGKSGMYDENRSMYGVSTCMLFSNVSNLSLTNLRFIHTAGFSVQIGNASNIYIDNVEFTECFADGLHINGNTSNALIKHIFGQVGDDIIALNMFDWKNSSINFGPMNMVWCEDIELYDSGAYKAIRIEPGTHTFSDGRSVDCRADNIVLKNIRGIKNFKLYLQTAPYDTSSPDIVAVGSGSNIYFEDVSVDLTEPIDKLENYVNSDPIIGSIAAFEFGANIENVSFENVSVTLHRDKYPQSYFVAVGPKSSRKGTKEIFDPYVECVVDNMSFRNVMVNGEVLSCKSDFIKEICFDNLYEQCLSSGYGKILNLNYQTT